MPPSGSSGGPPAGRGTAAGPAPGAAGWTTTTFGETWRRAPHLAGGLRALGVSAERPLMVLSDNSVTQGLLTFATMAAGAPIAPVSPAYSLLSQDHAKLKDVAAQLTPGAIYVEDAALYGKALAALGLDNLKSPLFEGSHKDASLQSAVIDNQHTAY